jgi:hypothetical protein
MQNTKHDTVEVVKLLPQSSIKSKGFIVVNNNTTYLRHLSPGCCSNQLYCLNRNEIQVNRNLIC